VAAGTDLGPYQIQRRLQVLMQAQVGIVRRQEEMESALAQIGELERQAAAVAVGGNREYNPGWHTALDLHNLLTVAAAVTRAALERRESRGAQFRDDYPGKDEALGKVNVAIRRGADGEMTVTRVPLVPASADQRRIIEEMQ
jgi:succinate dehydrogenase / fumarate reductase flavoprotein subunit